MSAPAPSDTKTIRVGTLEGKPVYGGELEVKLRVSGDEMILLEIFYAAGVGTPLHSHTRKSVIYLVSGKLKGTIDGKANRDAAGRYLPASGGRPAWRRGPGGFRDHGVQVARAGHLGVHG